jgi:hypothetical protein
MTADPPSNPPRRRKRSSSPAIFPGATDPETGATAMFSDETEADNSYYEQMLAERDD